MMLFRSAAKQIAAPARLSRHLHVPPEAAERDVERLAPAPVADARRARRVRPLRSDEQLSETGQHYLAGLLGTRAARARSRRRPSTATSATGPYSLAPDRVIWGRDNRGAMLRVIGGPGDTATRIENRVGEPPPIPTSTSPRRSTRASTAWRASSLPPRRPTRLTRRSRPPAGHARRGACRFARRACLKEGLGSAFVDYYCRIKESEIARFNPEVSEWEHREYFDLF